MHNLICLKLVSLKHLFLLVLMYANTNQPPQLFMCHHPTISPGLNQPHHAPLVWQQRRSVDLLEYKMISNYVMSLYRKHVDAPRQMANLAVHCSPLTIILNIVPRPHYWPDTNWTWYCWDPLWPLCWIVTALLMVDTSQLNGAKSHLVTCTMDTKCAKVRMHSCMVLAQSTD